MFTFFFFLLILPPPRSTLFPYTTLFRSVFRRAHGLTSRKVRVISASAHARSAGVSIPGAAGPSNNVTPIGMPCSNGRSEEHTSELQSRRDLVCRLLLEKKKQQNK